jgi:bifunctional ADP-heptose synthase (sugar kinase/adenylyltransferase)
MRYRFRDHQTQVYNRLMREDEGFDILHNGHVHLLNEARKTGDVLVVAL